MWRAGGDAEHVIFECDELELFRIKQAALLHSGEDETTDILKSVHRLVKRLEVGVTV